MKQHLKILLLEDTKDDVLLIERELQRSGMVFECLVANDRESFECGVTGFKPDVILCDHSLPAFNSIEALHIVQTIQKQTEKLIPFILVTANLSEEFAVQSMKAGVSDYIIKDRLKRLPLAIESAVEKCRVETERLQYMRQVIAKQTLMSEAEDLANFGSWQADLRSNKHSWSDATYRIYGFEPGEVEPGPDLFLSMVHPDDVEKVHASMSAVLSSANSAEHEYRIIDKKGVLKYISCKMHLHRDPAGQPVRVVGFNLDITPRKEAEIALERREQEYRSLFDHNPFAVFTMDVTGRVTNANSQILELTGSSLATLQKMKFTEFVREDELARVIRHFHDCLAGMPQRFEVTFSQGPSQEPLFFDVTYIPVVVEGKVVGVHGIGKDITKNKELEVLLEDAYRQARIGNWEVNLETNEVSWSKITRELHEVDDSFEPNIDQALLFVKEGEERDAVTRALKRAMEHGDTWDLETRIVTAKGNERWVRAVGRGVIRNGKCVRLLGTLQDIDDRKTAELALRQTNARKRQILESLGDGFLTVDRDWKVTYWNRQAEKLMGMPRENILGKNLWEVYTDIEDLAFYKENQRAMRDRVTVEFEALYPLLNIWLQCTIFPAEEGLSILFKDITAQRRAREDGQHGHNNEAQRTC